MIFKWCAYSLLVQQLGVRLREHRLRSISITDLGLFRDRAIYLRKWIFTLSTSFLFWLGFLLNIHSTWLINLRRERSLVVRLSLTSSVRLSTFETCLYFVLLYHILTISQTIRTYPFILLTSVSNIFH
jgi:hypothetical protein